MLEDSDSIAEAVTVITSRDHIVEADDDFENWRVVGGDWLTVGDPQALAICLSLNAGTGRLQ
ncbi:MULTISPECIES: hypothetical protein [unclassified Methylobacterium]|uniref:hypothetical protein n=1 Tax=unclassified Methylobacterium TaxID=2615210 RepID=UPI0011C1FEAD|nr:MULTISPECIES: hypothetical protein [unclassified Methylobacterium]QEE40703.1 hypothetical protein FVA80_18605 [Methylobacterium sp. WL1]TXN55845.1 hypothetical protein FV241_18045 [Methylobacterium sp. WL2]